jgi:hypothetical protein
MMAKLPNEGTGRRSRGNGGDATANIGKKNASGMRRKV